MSEPPASDSACLTGSTTRSSRSRSLVELRPGQFHVEVLGSGIGRSDEGQVDLGLLGGGELDLRLLGGLVQPLQRVLVRGQVHALILLELGHDPLDDRLVPVVAAEVVVAGGRLDLERRRRSRARRRRSPPAEVEHEDRLIGLLLEAVGQRGGSGLVDDPLDVEPGDLAGVLGRLALVVVEVRGTVITALSTVSPSFCSASDFSFCRIIAEISGGEYCFRAPRSGRRRWGRRRPCTARSSPPP